MTVTGISCSAMLRRGRMRLPGRKIFFSRAAKAHIELEPLFLETVTISDLYPMEVFVQQREDRKGTCVITCDTGFDVIELQGGRSKASFSYRVMAKRKGYEDERLRETDVGYNDPNLYPELFAKMEKQHEEERQGEDLIRKKHEQVQNSSGGSRRDTQDSSTEEKSPWPIKDHGLL